MTSRTMLLCQLEDKQETYNLSNGYVRDHETGIVIALVDTVHVNIDKYIEKYFRPILKPVLLYCDWNAQKKILKIT